MNEKILMLSNYSNNNKKVVDLTIRNHYEYCSKHNISFLYNIGQYSPINDFYELSILLQRYQTIITVGTDILFTDFKKDIRDFIDTNHEIIIQDEGTGTVNGDFIFWNKTPTIQKTLQKLWTTSGLFIDSQTQFNYYKDQINIKILPPRTIQSICPFGNEHNESIKHLLWQPGDFSVHCHRPGTKPDVNAKEIDLNQFKLNYSHYTTNL